MGLTVRQFLELWSDNISVRVLQIPIQKISKGDRSLIHRQTDFVNTLLNSGANYLDFQVVNLQMDFDLICVTCKANDEQAAKTINAHLYGK